MGAAVIRDEEFKWFLGVTHRIISPCMLEIVLITPKEALLQAWSYHLESVELDLDKALIGELQARPLSY